MSIIDRLYKHPLHNVAHYQPYLARYHEQDFTVIDHYRHLREILPIVEALEAKIKSVDFSPKLPPHLEFAFARSEELKKDIKFLEKYIPTPIQNEKLKAAKAYVKEIEAMDCQNKDGQLKIFTHFLVRVLGDLFGGQGLKTEAINAYKKENIYVDGTPEPGANFYYFRKQALQDFSKWLKELKDINEDEMTEIATSAYQNHIDIFKELESTRPTEAKLTIAAEKKLISDNSASFFSCKNLTRVALVTGLAIGAGVALANTISGPGR